jgi:hypothetical protein
MQSFLQVVVALVALFALQAHAVKHKPMPPYVVHEVVINETTLAATKAHATVGDRLLWNNKLMMGTTQVGWDAGECTVVATPKFAKQSPLWTCNWINVIEGKGQLAVSGYNADDQYVAGIEMAISGATDSFAGKSGKMIITSINGTAAAPGDFAFAFYFL